jgi:hypothetical protein
VVNAFLTVFLARRVKEIGPLFLAGLIIVMLGAVTVLIAAPHGSTHARQTDSAATAETADAQPDAPTLAAQSVSRNFGRLLAQLLAIALTVVSWGAYGPVLHNGQAAMHHSRLRPLICVGLAYFVIAVVVPYFFLGEMGEDSTYRSMGTLWSLLAGAFGAAGALGIILAFNSGGRPVFIMPLVFGGAPVVNTLFSVTRHSQWGQINAFFWAGLILVIAGAAMVLVLAPRGERSPESKVKSREPDAVVEIQPEQTSEGSAAGETFARG